MAEKAVRGVLADSQATALPQFTVMTLTGANDKEYLPVADASERPDGILVTGWDPDVRPPIVFEDETAQTPVETVSRNISVYSLDNPELEGVMDSGAVAVIPGDYVKAADGGETLDKWVTGSADYKLGLVKNAASAGEPVTYEPVRDINPV